jgi:hypothetical protein
MERPSWRASRSRSGPPIERRGWPRDERPFRPASVGPDGVRAGPRLARALIAASSGLSIAWPARSVVLFESLTGGGPARYVPLLEVPFGAGGAGDAGEGSGGGVVAAR